MCIENCSIPVLRFQGNHRMARRYSVLPTARADRPSGLGVPAERSCAITPHLLVTAQRLDDILWFGKRV